MDNTTEINQPTLMSYHEAFRFLRALEPTTPLPHGIACDTLTAERADDLAGLARARLAEGYVISVGATLPRPGQHRVVILFRRPGQR